MKVVNFAEAENTLKSMIDDVYYNFKYELTEV